MTDRPYPEIEIETATAEDVDKILSLIVDLSAWLETIGILQWSNSYPRHLIEDDIKARRVFVVRDKDEIAATVTLSEKMDSYWTDFPASAIYLHRLAVRRTDSGKCLGSRLIHWSENKVKTDGISFLRLDCHESNLRLREYYSTLGFRFRGVRHDANFNIDFALFEKDLNRPPTAVRKEIKNENAASADQFGI
jgi:GNAT superfamily N-acetyltransferase